jgi:hypothetical protein
MQILNGLLYETFHVLYIIIALQVLGSQNK